MISCLPVCPPACRLPTCLPATLLLLIPVSAPALPPARLPARAPAHVLRSKPLLLLNTITLEVSEEEWLLVTTCSSLQLQLPPARLPRTCSNAMLTVTGVGGLWTRARGLGGGAALVDVAGVCMPSNF